MTTTQEYIDIIVSALTHDKDIKVKNGKQWRVNIPDRELEYNGEHARSLPPMITKGLLIHEIGHLEYSEYDTSKYKDREYIKKYGNKAHQVYNLFEDIRIEQKQREAYGDFASQALAVANAYSFKDFSDNRENFHKLPKYVQALVLIGYYYNRYNTQYTDDLFSMNRIQLSENDASPEVKEVINNYYHRLSKGARTVSLAASQERALNYIDAEIMPILEPLMQGEPESEEQEIMKKTERKSSYSKRGSEKPIKTNRLTEEETKALYAPYIRTLSQRLKDILKELKATRYTGAHKEGKLLSKNAYKVMTDEQRIFSKKNKPNAPHYNIYIGIDCSGSMQEGDRVHFSFISAVMLNEVSKNIGFDVTLFQYDDRVEKMKNLQEYNGARGGNDEPYLFERVNSHIERNGRSEQENILFVITDGGTERGSHFIEQERQLKKNNCQLYGIGVGDYGIQDLIRNVYKNGVYAERPEDLPQQIIKLMRTIIHR